MVKIFYLSIACIGAVCSLFAVNPNEEIARGDERGGSHRDYRNDQHRNDYNHNDVRREYDRYQNHNFYGGRNSYEQNHWNNERHDINAYGEGIYDGVLLNNTYNPDVQYTPPGSTDNFNQVYEQNLE